MHSLEPPDVTAKSDHKQDYPYYGPGDPDPLMSTDRSLRPGETVKKD